MKHIPMYTCPICEKQAAAVWHTSDGVKLNPARCSMCLRTLGTSAMSVADAQAALARRLEDVL